MQRLIILPKTKEQLVAMKAILKAVKIDFKTEKNPKSLYSPEFAAKMKRGDEDIRAGRTAKIEPVIYGI